MLGALADLALKRPWGLLAANVAVAAAAVVASLGAPSELGIGSTRLEGSGDSDLVVVLRRDVAADTRVFEVAEDVITAQVETDPAVASVAPQRAGGSDDAGRVVLVGEFEDVSQAERQEAVERLEEGIDPGPLRVEIGGETAVLTEARRSLGGDLWRVVLGIELPAMVADLRRDEAALSPEPRALRHAVGEGALRTALIAGAASLPALALLMTPLDEAASLALGCALAAWLAAASALTSTPALLRLLQTEATVETASKRRMPRKRASCAGCASCSARSPRRHGGRWRRSRSGWRPWWPSGLRQRTARAHRWPLRTSPGARRLGPRPRPLRVLDLLLVRVALLAALARWSG
jgi:hypothetical protein